MADIKLVQLHLTSVIQFLRPLLPLANCHMVNFFTGNFWDRFISYEIQKDYESVGLPGMYKLFWHFMKYKNKPDEDCESAAYLAYSPSLSRYFFDAGTMYLGALHEVNLSYSEFQHQLASWKCDNNDAPYVREFMSPKKTHEVEMMSKVVAAVTQRSGVHHIADVGGGKGYLSSMLALQHGLRVLGVDSSHTNTHGAAKRTEKLQKFWPGLQRRAAERSSGKASSRRGKHWKAREGASPQEAQGSEMLVAHAHTGTAGTSSTASTYKQWTLHVTEQSDMERLMRENFPDSASSHMALVGLHTCGNLAATCLKLFTRNESIRALCNVGCCYHLIDEKFSSHPLAHPNDEKPLENGFPLSRFLNDENFTLGRNARMLAAQSVDRLSEKKEISVTSLFFRALLQVLLYNKFGEDRSDWQVGRIAAKSKDFADYYSRSLKQLNIDLELSPSEVSALHNQYLHRRNELEAFFLLRVALAPAIETVILLDRLLYLLEQGVRDAHLVQLFDPVISPRCYAVVALKDNINAVN